MPRLLIFWFSILWSSMVGHNLADTLYKTINLNLIIKDHLTNIEDPAQCGTRAVVVADNSCSGPTYEAQYDYYPYGKVLRKWEAPRSRFQSTDHETDLETGYNNRNARWYDDESFSFLGCDPMAKKYPSLSPYSYVARNPLAAIDKNGKEIFFVVYTGGVTYDYVTTRVKEIESSSHFDKNVDKVISIDCYDLGKLENYIESNITKYAERYGKTAEVSFYGHGGVDGPVGAEPTSRYSLFEVTHNELDKNQLSPTGWRNIDFNFNTKSSSVSFYGCNTEEFALKFLNYSNVLMTSGTSGQTGPAYNSSGPINRSYFNMFSRNVYQVAINDDGMILPNKVFSRQFPALKDSNGKTITSVDSEGSMYINRQSVGYYGNLGRKIDWNKLEFVK